MVQHLMMAALLAATLGRGMFHFFVVVVLLMEVFQMTVGQGQAGSGNNDEKQDGKRAHEAVPFNREDAISIG